MIDWLIDSGRGVSAGSRGISEEGSGSSGSGEFKTGHFRFWRDLRFLAEGFPRVSEGIPRKGRVLPVLGSSKPVTSGWVTSWSRGVNAALWLATGQTAVLHYWYYFEIFLFLSADENSNIDIGPIQVLLMWSNEIIHFELRL